MPKLKIKHRSYTTINVDTKKKTVVTQWEVNLPGEIKIGSLVQALQEISNDWPDKNVEPTISFYEEYENTLAYFYCEHKTVTDASKEDLAALEAERAEVEATHKVQRDLMSQVLSRTLSTTEND